MTDVSLGEPCPPKTRLDLDWDRILRALAARCVGPMGREAALGLEFASTRAQTRMLLAEASEAVRLHKDGQPLPIEEVADIREALGRLRVGGVLAPGELRAIAQVMSSARSLRRFLQSRRSGATALGAALATDPTLDALADEISDAFDADGTLSDRASPTLRALRAEQQAAKKRLLSRLEDVMNRYERVLQDRFITEREGRFVIPVRSDAHERFPGIVHATSASGSTIFVEPRVVIPMGNRLKMLDADVQREEIAVYTHLSSLLSDALPSLEACREAMAKADVREATARLADELALTFPNVVDQPKIDLRGARHPLLALDLPAVIPSDLEISSGRAMIISGPNAGGKTVALKTLGLAALMIRAGLPVACDEGSTVGIFEVVLSDVGDDQSLTKSLSTFSAHISNIASILGETRPGALVLLDELAGGTDPREGEALAAGVLDSLSSRGGAVVTTTHYEGLKALALADERFANASVGFDIATMSPTFRVAMGVPGSSSALAVARRFGMPATVIERAERFLSREDHNFETVVKRLNDERAALELARAAATSREEEARQTKTRLEVELDAARNRETRALSRELEALVVSLRRAQADLRSAQGTLRAKKPEERDLKEAARAIDRVAGAVSIGGELERLIVPQESGERAPVRREELRRGSKVYVPRLRSEGAIVELLPEGLARVAVGAMKLTVALDTLRHAELPEDEARPPTPTKRESREIRPLEPAIMTRDNTCDLRGLRADDAVSLSATFLDRSINERRGVAFLLHGHGTGALKEAIRKDLKASPYVAHFRPGNSDEGGDGVTVVWLA